MWSRARRFSDDILDVRVLETPYPARVRIKSLAPYYVHPCKGQMYSADKYAYNNYHQVLTHSRDINRCECKSC